MSMSKFISDKKKKIVYILLLLLLFNAFAGSLAYSMCLILYCLFILSIIIPRRLFKKCFRTLK